MTTYSGTESGDTNNYSMQRKKNQCHYHIRFGWDEPRYYTMALKNNPPSLYKIIDNILTCERKYFKPTDVHVHVIEKLAIVVECVCVCVYVYT